MWWLIDGNNVMGAGADGWWRDREGAAARLTERIAEWCRAHGQLVTVVFDGKARSRVIEATGGDLTVEFAARPGRDAADDLIVALVRRRSEPETLVVTSDRGLIARLPGKVATEGAGAFRSRIGLSHGGRS